MYLHNKYTTWYFNIINNAKSRDPSGYSEKHHIIPKSLGGTNLAENLVNLTAREHFICHLLLTKMTSNKLRSKMVHAVWLMTNRRSKTQDRYIPNSRIYNIVREERNRILSKNVGNKNPMFGRKHTAETRARLKEAAKHKPKPSKELVEKRRNTLLSKNYTHSIETRKKMQLAAKNREVGTCKFCGVICITSLLKRWHNENCKLSYSYNTTQHDPTSVFPSN
jgi:5-methylcytosine-specific restriction endonuclease McrA